MAAILAALMLCSLFAGVISMNASASTKIDNLKKQKEQLAAEKKALQQKISDAKNEQYSLLQKKKTYDSQMTIVRDEIENVTNLITEYTEFIAQCEKDIAANQIKEKKQWDAYKRRVRAMEENGTISYIEVLFTATTLTELLSQIDSIGEIMEKDKKIYDDLIAIREELERQKAERENAVVELEASKVELKEREEELSALIKEAEAIIQQYEDSINKLKSDVSEIEKEDKAVDAAIKKAQEEESAVKGEGTFLWPSQASKYVTSKFGYRTSPTAGASTNHKGIDIGAASGTNILASKSGTVRVATYSASYGYYVVINHGDGTTTTYAHMSRILTSVGKVVKQGEVIGLVGSTGISTGSHIHFEISINGTRVDPLKYFSGYTLSPRA